MGLRARGPIRGVRVVPALGTKPNQKSEKTKNVTVAGVNEFVHGADARSEAHRKKE